jgi:hypothetical protein
MHRPFTFIFLWGSVFDHGLARPSVPCSIFDYFPQSCQCQAAEAPSLMFPRIACDFNSLFVPSAYRKALLFLTRRATNRVCNILCKMTNRTHAENGTLLLKGRFSILFLFIGIYFLAVGQYLLLKYPERTISILLFPIQLLYGDLSMRAWYVLSALFFFFGHTCV